ncbi:MAG: histidinol-phosphate transaminase [Burkholderiales bacterium]|jgi:histidinol-phosphate aminotransferase|nr:histidinol-phosphate transaminase [Burkholderiales bacterium]
MTVKTAPAVPEPLDLCERAPSYVRAISAYQPGKPITELARDLGLDERNIVKLASNENPLGLSPKARAAIEAALPELARYPDQFDLVAAIARKLGVAQESVVLGNGSNDLLEMVAAAFLAPGRSSVFSQHAFAVYPLATQSRGAASVVVAARDFGHDLDAMLAAIRPDTHVVFIANPNNPTGTFLPEAEVRRFLDRAPGSVAVVLDEAYNEYLAPELRADTVAWVSRYPNLVVTRTFSKAYGLAGLRVGYALCHPRVADLLNRVRQPFNVNNLALAAAIAALDDAPFMARSYELNRAGMKQLTDGFARLGLAWIPSHGNFVSVEIPRGGGNSRAGAVYQSLLRQGVIVRPVAGYAMPDHLRVTVGLPEENERFLVALAKALEF